jgi:hypothetical protein
VVSGSILWDFSVVRCIGTYEATVYVHSRTEAGVPEDAQGHGDDQVPV